MNFNQRSIAILTAVGALMISSQGQALEPNWKVSRPRNFWPDCVGKRCCDDYCAKPLPCIAGVECFDCPNYCPKPLPCAAPVNALCCDDYCPKRLPPVCCPTNKNLRCVPSRLPPTKVTSVDQTTEKLAGKSSVTGDGTRGAPDSASP